MRKIYIRKIADSRKPKYKDHWKIIECGMSIKEDLSDSEIEKLSPKYRDLIPKREKEKHYQIKVYPSFLTSLAGISVFLSPGKVHRQACFLL